MQIARWGKTNCTLLNTKPCWRNTHIHKHRLKARSARILVQELPNALKMMLFKALLNRKTRHEQTTACTQSSTRTQTLFVVTFKWDRPDWSAVRNAVNDTWKQQSHTHTHTIISCCKRKVVRKTAAMKITRWQTMLTINAQKYKITQKTLQDLYGEKRPFIWWQ